jgi:NAD(P)-dependent dehydrogenase (short-subunit alcohol dehydrogenase family)
MRKGTVIVTGASRGIGAAIAADLDRRGYRVAGLSRTGVCASGKGYACDMTDETDIAGTVAKIAADGPLVGLVNNAGQYALGRSDRLATADYESLMRVNATSVMITSREAYPHLKAAGGSLIVNLSSFFAKLGVAQHLAYCASKAAIAAMTRCLAVEWARDGIRVLAVAPGYIATDFNSDFFATDKGQELLAARVPVRRAGETAEVGRLVGALFDADIGFLTGETIHIDGGQGINL